MLPHPEHALCQGSGPPRGCDGDCKVSVERTHPSATNAVVADGAALGRIADEEGPIAVCVGDSWAWEGNAGDTPLTVTVTLSAAPGPAARSRSTTHRRGYGHRRGPRRPARRHPRLRPGRDVQDRGGQPRGDIAVKPTETLRLTAARGALVADNAATGTVVNDDGTPAADPLPKHQAGVGDQVRVIEVHPDAVDAVGRPRSAGPLRSGSARWPAPCESGSSTSPNEAGPYGRAASGPEDRHNSIGRGAHARRQSWPAARRVAPFLRAVCGNSVVSA